MKKNQTIEIPEWVKWAVVLLIGIPLLKKVAPLLFRVAGVANPVAKIEDNVNAAAVKAVIAENPGGYKLADGSLYGEEKADLEAQYILYDLGLKGSSWYPGNWFENDKFIHDRLKTHTRGSFSILRRRYDSKYNRSLTNDLETYLDKDLLNNVIGLWK